MPATQNMESPVYNNTDTISFGGGSSTTFFELDAKVKLDDFGAFKFYVLGVFLLDIWDPPTHTHTHTDIEHLAGRRHHP